MMLRVIWVMTLYFVICFGSLVSFCSYYITCFDLSACHKFCPIRGLSRQLVYRYISHPDGTSSLWETYLFSPALPPRGVESATLKYLGVIPKNFSLLPTVDLKSLQAYSA